MSRKTSSPGASGASSGSTDARNVALRRGFDAPGGGGHDRDELMPNDDLLAGNDDLGGDVDLGDDLGGDSGGDDDDLT